MIVRKDMIAANAATTGAETAEVIAVVVAMGVMMLASKPLMAFVGRHPTVVILCLGLLLAHRRLHARLDRFFVLAGEVDVLDLHGFDGERTAHDFAQRDGEPYKRLVRFRVQLS